MAVMRKCEHGNVRRDNENNAVRKVMNPRFFLDIIEARQQLGSTVRAVVRHPRQPALPDNRPTGPREFQGGLTLVGNRQPGFGTAAELPAFSPA
jgi:hypothetical protein